MNEMGAIFLTLFGVLLGFLGRFGVAVKKVNVGIRGLVIWELTGPVARFIGIMYALGGGAIALSGLLAMSGGALIPHHQSVGVVTITFGCYIIANVVGIIPVRHKRHP